MRLSVGSGRAANFLLSRSILSRCSLLSESRDINSNVGSFPSLLETCFDQRGLIEVDLCLQSFHETILRPAVSAIAFQVGPVHGFCFGRSSGFQKYSGQLFTRWIVPLCRFGIDQSILQTDSALEMSNSSVVIRF